MLNSKKMLAQGLVEFALTLPILLLLILGTMDLGRAFYLKVALENSAREGAYYMVYNREEGIKNGFALAKAAVQVEGENSGLNLLSTEINVVCRIGGVIQSTCPKGSTVEVVAHQTMDMLVLGFLFGPLDLSGQARMLIP